jgi:UrcA family protein
MKSTNHLVLSTAMLLAYVWVAPAAFAEKPIRSQKVTFSDLKTDTPAGAQALFGRIHEAAKRVCSQTDPVYRAAVIPCISRAEAKAVATLNLPQLTAVYEQKTGIQSPLVAGR